MTDTQNEVFKTPVNKIRLFEHGAPGSQNFKLTRKYYTEDMPDGRVKHIVQNITDPDIVPYIPDGIGNSTDRQRILFLYLCEQRVNIRACTRIWSLLQ